MIATRDLRGLVRGLIDVGSSPDEVAAATVNRLLGG